MNGHGHSIQCARCGGHGLVLSMSSEPDECSDCGGSGCNWQYPGGAIARYYSGPLLGRDAFTQSTREAGLAKAPGSNQ